MKKFSTKLFVAFLSFIFTAISIKADTITIHNKTDFEIYAAIYSRKMDATRVSNVVFVAPNSNVSMPRLKGKRGYHRRLVFSLKKEELQLELARDKYKLLGRIDIGRLTGSNFFIALEKGRLKGYNHAQWKVKPIIKKTVTKVLSGITKVAFKPLRKKYLKKSPNFTKKASLRRSKDISSQEKQYLKRRLEFVQKALEKKYGTKVDKPLRIALVGSGGGCRAMLRFLGGLLGAQDIGLLDMVTYVVGLSGSTWAIGPWISSGLSLEKFKEQLTPRLETDIIKEKIDVKKGAELLLKKFIFNQPLSIIDPYGAVLARKFLSGFAKNPHEITLEDQSKRIEAGQWPFPIYSAIITRKDPVYQWFEFNPYDVGSDYLGGYIPTWALGRKFINGDTQNFSPSQSLGYILGICGSAFSVNAIEAWAKISTDIGFEPIKKILQKIIENARIAPRRLRPAKLPNFTRGILDLPRGNKKTLTLIDAGIFINIPISLLFRQGRNIDIIIVFDASSGLKRGSASSFEKSIKELEKKGIKLPEIKDFEQVTQKPCSVFYDEKDPSVPVVIYMPIFPVNILNEKKYLSTFNFKYTPKQSKEFIELNRSNMKNSADLIFDAIKKRLDLPEVIEPTKITAPELVMPEKPPTIQPKPGVIGSRGRRRAVY